MRGLCVSNRPRRPALASLARLAVDAAVRAVGEGYFLRTADDKSYSLILKKGLLAALAAVKEKANQLDVSVRDLASTLILVVTTGNLVAAAQVGDGAAVIGDRSGNIIPLTIPYGVNTPIRRLFSFLPMVWKPLK